MTNQINSHSNETSASNSAILDVNSSKMFFNKRRFCPLCTEVAAVNSDPKKPNRDIINYKNPNLLSKYISECGRILPSRITNICAKHQRSLRKAIMQSRHIALLPFVYNLDK